MKKAIFAIAIVLFSAAAAASCPPYSPYRCVPGPMGKQLCGCGY